MVSRLSPDGRLSLMAGGGEDASPLTGEPARMSTLPAARTIDQHAVQRFLLQSMPPCSIGVSPIVGTDKSCNMMKYIDTHTDI